MSINYYNNLLSLIFSITDTCIYDVKSNGPCRPVFSVQCLPLAVLFSHIFHRVTLFGIFLAGMFPMPE